MLRDASLHCLAGAVEVGLIQTATAGAHRYDPLLRGAIRARVQSAVRAAAAATRVPPDGDGETHHLRLAFLIRAGRADVATDDVAAVTKAYASAAAGYPRKGIVFWPLTAALLLAMALGAATAVALFFWPTAEERFRKTAVAKALDKPLTDYVVAIGRQGSPAGLARLQKSRNELLSADVKAQIGSEAAQQLGDVLLHAANVASVAPDAIESETSRLDDALSILNLRLAEHKVPACLDAYIVPRQTGAAVWLLGYYAKRQVEVAIDDEKSTVFWGSRLDDLNFTSGGGAYKSGEGRSVIISLDDLEGEVLREVLPALGGDGKLSLGVAFETGATSTVTKAQKKLTELVRAELVTTGLIGESTALDIAEIVSRRDVVLAGMRWEGRGGRKLRLTPKWSEELRALHDLTANQALKLDDRLSSPDYARAVARAVDAVALLQEEEFVGYLQAYKDKALDTPAELEEVAGKSVLARATLASRLALLARPQAHVGSELARLATTVMTPGWSAWAMRGAVVVVASIARELGASAVVVANERVDLDAFADAIVGIASHRPEEIRGAAERAYRKMFSRPVPKLERRAL